MEHLSLLFAIQEIAMILNQEERRRMVDEH